MQFDLSHFLQGFQGSIHGAGPQQSYEIGLQDHTPRRHKFLPLNHRLWNVCNSTVRYRVTESGLPSKLPEWVGIWNQAFHGICSLVLKVFLEVHFRGGRNTCLKGGFPTPRPRLLGRGWSRPQGPGIFPILGSGRFGSKRPDPRIGAISGC